MSLEAWEHFQLPSPKDPKVELTFGCRPFTPLTTCQDIHPGGPIPKGHHVCCAANHCTGVEGHPSLKRDRRTDPKPEPPTVYTAPADPKAKLTRKQKRAAIAAAKLAVQQATP